MIAEEDLQRHMAVQSISINTRNLTLAIINSMKQTVSSFNSYIVNFLPNKRLNEDELTQVFVEQLDIQLRRLDYPFGVKNQYRDIYYGSRGFSDFYFHPIEEGKSTASIFSVESKRLPSPTLDREKEYVMGSKENGGIERYKIEKHGKGLSECGMLGFIEKENSEFWIKTINNWIKDLSKSNAIWKADEIIKEIEQSQEHVYLNSIVHTTTARNILLHHIWINYADKTFKNKFISIIKPSLNELQKTKPAEIPK